MILAVLSPYYADLHKMKLQYVILKIYEQGNDNKHEEAAILVRHDHNIRARVCPSDVLCCVVLCCPQVI